MNVRLLKAKRVERGIQQKELAKALNITEKTMCHKECSEENKFKAEEMLILVKQLNLSFAEFDAIFFNHELTKCLRRTQKLTNEKQRQQNVKVHKKGKRVIHITHRAEEYLIWTTHLLLSFYHRTTVKKR